MTCSDYLLTFRCEWCCVFWIFLIFSNFEDGTGQAFFNILSSADSQNTNRPKRFLSSGIEFVEEDFRDLPYNNL